MKTSSRTVIGFAGAAAGALVCAGAAQSANLVVNGDFSSPNVGSGYSITPSIPGWFSDTNDGIEVGNSTIYGLPCANAACQNLEVNADTFGSVSQTVTGLTPGATYTFSYAYGGRTSGGPDILDVSFGGTLLATNTGSVGVFTPFSFSVLATSSSETITFASEDTSALGGLPSYGNEVTNVSLSTVPEPASWALMLVGVAGLGAALRRRAKPALAV